MDKLAVVQFQTRFFITRKYEKRAMELSVWCFPFQKFYIFQKSNFWLQNKFV